MKKLLILSGKGGTGKTTTAMAFATFSNATAIADCDVDAPNLHLALKHSDTPNVADFYGGKKAFVNTSGCIACGKCEKQCQFNAIKVIYGNAHVDQITCEGCGVCKIVCPTHCIKLEQDVAGKLTLYKSLPIFSTAELKMGRGNSGKLVAEVKSALYSEAKEQPLAIIDGSPGIGCPVIASISGVDLVLVVAEPSVSGLSDLKRLLKTANVLNVLMAVCVNKCDTNEQKTKEIEDFCTENGVRFVGKIPFDKAIPQIINNNVSIQEVDCPAKSALFDVYQKTMSLMQEEN